MPAASRLPALLALTLAPLALAACGSSSKPTTAPRAATTPHTVATTPPAAAQPGKVIASTSRDLRRKPVVPRQTAAAPTKLVIQDIVKGKGPVARSGSKVNIAYVGVLYDSGQQFDASWDRGGLLPFQVGAGGVIPGFDRGVEGMRVGGRRQITIPPELGYGAQASGPIPPNSTLIFVVDLKKIG